MIEVGESTDNGASPPTANDLKEIVQKYRVCYEVWPEWAIVAEKRLKIGFDLQLCGSNDHRTTGEEHAIPGRICFDPATGGKILKK